MNTVDEFIKPNLTKRFYRPKKKKKKKKKPFFRESENSSN